MTEHRPRRSEPLMMRCTAAEADAVRAAAKQLGLTVAEFMRRAVAAAITALRPPTITTGSSTTIVVDSDATWSHLG